MVYYLLYYNQGKGNKPHKERGINYENNTERT